MEPPLPVGTPTLVLPLDLLPTMTQPQILVERLVPFQAKLPLITSVVLLPSEVVDQLVVMPPVLLVQDPPQTNV
jgi:hypothetical protein